MDTFNHKDYEKLWYDRWVKKGCFKAQVSSKKEPYTIMMPPPNVTGSLHIGHALTFTLQDILIRYFRMKGHDVLWQPGTDHAGIATQMVVERQLNEKGIDRRDIGRNDFLNKVWEWKEHSGGQITNQLRALGASPDWDKERFTMDDGLSSAVKKVFVKLFNEGLIYKDKRLVNWDTKLLTAISDLEVEQREMESQFWYIKYPLENTKNFIVVATTRPETMLGDVAVAVNPKDERYNHFIGKNLILPIANRKIPIISDDYTEIEKGTGAVKITPAHDFNAFEDNVGRFMTEYGMQSFPSMSMVESFTHEKDRSLDSDVMNAHQKASLGTGNLMKYIEDYYRVNDDFESIVGLSQIMQAEAIRFAVEAHRRNMPYCMGTLYWQFNDCWPVISWSSIDYGGNWKALHYAARKFFSPILVSIRDLDDKIEIHVINDQHHEVESRIRLGLFNLNGDILFKDSSEINVEPFSSTIYRVFDKNDFLGGIDLSRFEPR